MPKSPTTDAPITFTKDKITKNGAIRYSYNPEGGAPITGTLYFRGIDPEKAPETINVKVVA